MSEVSTAKVWGPRPLWSDGFTEVRPLVHVNWSKINKQEFYHKTLKGLRMKKKLYRRNGHSITYMYISIVKENEDMTWQFWAIPCEWTR